MNHTFKVASNALRGTVVCSEKSSSYQGRAVKTVIASAVAALAMGAAGAMAADSTTPAEDPLFWQDKVVTEDVTIAENTTLKIHSATLQSGTITVNGGATYDYDPKIGVGNFTMTGGAVDVKDGKAFSVKDFTMTGGKILANGSTAQNSYDQYGRTYPAFGSYNTFVMEGGDVELKNGGRLWIGSSYSKDADSFNRMELKGGTIAMNGGGFITGDKLLIASGSYTSDKGGEDHQVTYDKNTLAYNTIGLDGVTLKVAGTGNVINAVATELTAGTIDVAKDGELKIVATTSTNQGTQDAQHTTNRTTAETAINAVSRFEVKGGTFTNNGKVVSDVKDYVVSNGTVTNNGQMSVKDLTITGGTLSTVYQQPGTDDKADQPYFTWESISLKGGVLNLAAANSRIDGVTIDAEHPGDRLLLNYGTWNLAGGDLQVAGKSWTGALKVGKSNTGTQLNISADGYAFDSIEFGSAKETNNVSALTLTNDATLTVGTLDYTLGNANITDGTLVVNKLVWDNTGITGNKQEGTLNVGADGVVITTGDQLFVKSGEGEEVTWAATAAGSHVSGSGIITITDTFEATAAQIKAANALINNGGNVLYFQNVTLTDEKVSFDQALGLGGINNEVAAPEANESGAVTLEIDSGKTVGVGSLAVSATTTDVTVAPSNGQTGTGELVIGGTAQGGNVITGVAKVKTLTTGDLSLGKDEASKGTVNAETVNVTGDLDVTGDWTAEKVVLSTSGNSVSANSALTAETLGAAAGTNSAILANNGTLAVNRIEAQVDLKKGSTLVLGERIQVEKAAEAAPATFALLRTASEPAAQTGTETELGQQIASTVSTGTDVDVVVTTNANGRTKFLAAAGNKYDATKNVGLYADSTIGVDGTKGKLIVGTYAQDYTPVAGTVTLGNNSVTVLDLPSFADGSAVFAANYVNIQNDAQIVLVGADDISKTLFVEGGEVTGATSGKLETANKFLKADFEVEKDKLDQLVGTNIVVSYNDEAVSGPLGEVVKGFYISGTSDANKAVVTAVGNSAYFGADGKLSAEGTQALSEYVSMPVTAGLYNAAYDAQNAFTGAVQERALEKSQSYGVWANAYYAQNEAKTLYGETGYESDVYGGVMGADATFSCGARLGAAFTFGKADVDSKNTVNPISTDSDFWGVSIYAAKDLAGVNLAADVSYVALENDIEGSIAGASMDESVDSSVWTVGFKGEYAFDLGAVEIVPHAGVRYAAVDVDDYRGFEAEKLNVVELPVGVTVKGNFETAGLAVKPFLDLTAAPQLGDKEVDTILGETDVLGHVYNAKVGVEAATGAFTFGAHYSYGFGSDDRSNNVFGLKASYNF